MSVALRGVAVAVVVAASCRGTDSRPPPPPEQAPIARQDSLSCWQILQCYTPCGTDAACLDACLARGDRLAQAQVNAVIECTARCNNQQTCIHDSCRALITTCQNAVTAPAQPHATENLLPWLTGGWVATNHQFAFTADGTVERSVSVALGGGCASTIVASGPVRQEDDLLIMDLGAETARSCNTPVEGGGAKQVRYRIEWVQVNGTTQLQLRELDCTKGGDLYCTELMTRR